MKAILEFNLPEDTEEFKMATEGWRYKSTIDDIFAKLRQHTKYESKYTFTDEEIITMINTAREENGLL